MYHAFSPTDLQVILRSSSYDEENGEWRLPRTAYPTSYPTVDDSGRTFGANSNNGNAYSGRIGPGSSGPNTLATNPGLYEQRADATWRRSIRTDFGPSAPPDSARRLINAPGPRGSRFTPAPPSGAKPYSGMYGDLTLSTSSSGGGAGGNGGRTPSGSDNNTDVIDTLPRRAGFVPNSNGGSGVAPSPSSGAYNNSMDASFASLEGMRPRPGFAPAAPVPPSPRDSFSGVGAPGNVGVTPDLSGLQRRPGFAPAGPAAPSPMFGASNGNMSGNDSSSLLAAASQTARRPGFAPATHS